MAKTHGMRYTRLYSIWTGMKGRCLCPKINSYARYGGRGIEVCAEWKKFIPFMEWALVNGYSDNKELDRQDGAKGYYPNNCRFTTKKQNCRNKDDNFLLTAFSETKCLIDWVEDDRCKCSYQTLWKRLRSYGWIPEKAITTPTRKWKRKTIQVSCS